MHVEIIDKDDRLVTRIKLEKEPKKDYSDIENLIEQGFEDFLVRLQDKGWLDENLIAKADADGEIYYEPKDGNHYLVIEAIKTQSSCAYKN